MENINRQFHYLQWFMFVFFVMLSLSFVFNLWGDKHQVVPNDPVADVFFTKNPVQNPRLKPQTINVKDGKLYTCNECHAILEPTTVQKSFYSAHPDIDLQHGINNYCSTCHHPQDRDKLTDIHQEKVDFSESHKTCMQCHGPIFRDWENGVHGRMNDYWDKSKGAVRKLTCVACHNPHAPTFPKMEPAPAPKLIQSIHFLESLAPKENTHE